MPTSKSITIKTKIIMKQIFLISGTPLGGIIILLILAIVIGYIIYEKKYQSK